MNWFAKFKENPFGHLWECVWPAEPPRQEFRASDYRRCGPLYYPVRFLGPRNIEVINQPKSEAEIRKMMIKEKIQQNETNPYDRGVLG